MIEVDVVKDGSVGGGVFAWVLQLPGADKGERQNYAVFFFDFSNENKGFLGSLLPLYILLTDVGHAFPLENVIGQELVFIVEMLLDGTVFFQSGKDVDIAVNIICAILIVLRILKNL